MDLERFANRFFRSGRQGDWNDDERIVLLARKHTFFLLRSMAMPAILMAALLMYRIVPAWTGTDGNPLFVLALNIPLLVYLVIGLVLAFWLVMAFIEWENDYFLITDQRIMCQRQAYRFVEEMAEVNLARIQDISVRVLSPFANLLGFGDIVVSTAGVGGELTFTNISSPEEVKALIFFQIEQLEERIAETHRQQVRDKLENELGFRG